MKIKAMCKKCKKMHAGKCASHERKDMSVKKEKKNKVKKVMHEFKDKELLSGSKKGPLVTNEKQAIAIGLSEAKKMAKKKKK